jgi:hypothetical protein
MQRYIEKYAVTSIVTLNSNGKYDRHTNRYRYYRYRILNEALRVPLNFENNLTVTFADKNVKSK